MDLKKYLVRLSGKEYLPVAARVAAFRETHPNGVISTELIATEPVVIVRASIHAADGVMLATGYGTAPLAGKGSYAGRGIEKSETAAIGRALAHAGFGTLYATDADDDTDAPNHLADSPQPAVNGKPEPPPAPNGWTQEQAASFNTECRQKNVTPAEALGVLGVAKLSEFEPGFSAARKLIADYLKARPAQPDHSAQEVVF